MNKDDTRQSAYDWIRRKDNEGLWREIEILWEHGDLDPEWIMGCLEYAIDRILDQRDRLENQAEILSDKDDRICQLEDATDDLSMCPHCEDGWLVTTEVCTDYGHPAHPTSWSCTACGISQSFGCQYCADLSASRFPDGTPIRDYAVGCRTEGCGGFYVVEDRCQNHEVEKTADVGQWTLICSEDCGETAVTYCEQCVDNHANDPVVVEPPEHKEWYRPDKHPPSGTQIRFSKDSFVGASKEGVYIDQYDIIYTPGHSKPTPWSDVVKWRPYDTEEIS